MAERNISWNIIVRLIIKCIFLIIDKLRLFAALNLISMILTQWLWKKRQKNFFFLDLEQISNYNLPIREIVLIFIWLFTLFMPIFFMPALLIKDDKERFLSLILLDDNVMA